MDIENDNQFENDDFSGFSSGDIDADFLADEYAPKDTNNETIEPIQKVARNEQNKSLLNFGSTLQIGDESPFSVSPQNQQSQKAEKNENKANNNPIDLKSFLQTPVGSVANLDDKSNATGSRLLIKKTIDKAQDKSKPKVNIFPIPLNESSSLNFDTSSLSNKNSNNNATDSAIKVSQFTLPGIPVLSNDQNNNNNLPPLGDKNNLNPKQQTSVKVIKVASGNATSSTNNSDAHKPNEDAKPANVNVPAPVKNEGSSIKVTIKPRFSVKQKQQNQQEKQQISQTQQQASLQQSSTQQPQQQSQNQQLQIQSQQNQQLQQQQQLQNQQQPQQQQVQNQQQMQNQKVQQPMQNQQQQVQNQQQQIQNQQTQNQLQNQQQQIKNQQQSRQLQQQQIQNQKVQQPIQNQQQQIQNQQAQQKQQQTPVQQTQNQTREQQNQLQTQKQELAQTMQQPPKQQQFQTPQPTQQQIQSHQFDSHQQQQNPNQNIQNQATIQQAQQQNQILQQQIQSQQFQVPIHQQNQSNFSPTQNFAQSHSPPFINQTNNSQIIQQQRQQTFPPPQPPFYNFPQIQQQPYNPLAEHVNFSFSAALDNSFSSIRRSVATELSKVLRNSSSSSLAASSYASNSLAFDVDSFILNLNNDLVSALSFASPADLQNHQSQPLQPSFNISLNPILNLNNYNASDFDYNNGFSSVNVNMNLNGGETMRNGGYQTMLHSIQNEPMLLRPLVNGINSVIDQEMKPLSTMMKDSMQEKSKMKAENVNILNNLLNQVESMRMTCKNFCDEIIRELEGEELMAASRRDFEVLNCKKNAKKLREMKLQFIEFESKAKQQEIELKKNSELFDRLKQQIIFYIEKSNRKFNDNARVRYDDQMRSPQSSNSFELEKILDEINEIENDIQNGGYGHICGEFENLYKCFQNDKNSMSDELLNIEYMNQQLLLSRTKFNSINSNLNSYYYNQNLKQPQYNQNYNSNIGLNQNSGLNISKQNQGNMNSMNSQMSKTSDANKRMSSYRKQRDTLMQSNLA